MATLSEWRAAIDYHYDHNTDELDDGTVYDTTYCDRFDECLMCQALDREERALRHCASRIRALCPADQAVDYYPPPRVLPPSRPESVLDEWHLMTAIRAACSRPAWSRLWAQWPALLTDVPCRYRASATAYLRQCHMAASGGGRL